MSKKSVAALAGALVVLATSAFAQSAWPNKPIKLVAPYPPGGQTDVVSRYFAEKLSAVLGQQVIVDNKPGANGMVGMEIVKNLPADGYTFVYVNSSMMCINPYVYKKMPYDGLKDFMPVTQHGLAPLVMSTPPALGLKSVKEFVAWAKHIFIGGGGCSVGCVGHGVFKQTGAKQGQQFACAFLHKLLELAGGLGPEGSEWAEVKTLRVLRAKVWARDQAGLLIAGGD